MLYMGRIRVMGNYFRKARINPKACERFLPSKNRDR